MAVPLGDRPATRCSPFLRPLSCLSPSSCCADWMADVDPALIGLGGVALGAAITQVADSIRWSRSQRSDRLQRRQASLIQFLGCVSDVSEAAAQLHPAQQRGVRTGLTRHVRVHATRSRWCGPGARGARAPGGRREARTRDPSDPEGCAVRCRCGGTTSRRTAAGPRSRNASRSSTLRSRLYSTLHGSKGYWPRSSSPRKTAGVRSGVNAPPTPSDLAARQWSNSDAYQRIALDREAAAATTALLLQGLR